MVIVQRSEDDLREHGCGAEGIDDSEPEYIQKNQSMMADLRFKIDVADVSLPRPGS